MSPGAGRLLRRALAVALSTAAGLGVAELLVRAWPRPPGTRSTAIGGSAGQPRFAQPGLARSAGITGRPGIPDKLPGTFRVLALGDSFTWGAGVRAEDAWPGRLGRHLSLRAWGRRIEVVNAGGSGWNTSDEHRALCERFLDAEPDLVVLGICLNDPEPSGRARLRLRGALERRESGSLLSELLLEHSALFSLVSDRLENERQRRAFSAYYVGLYDPGQPGWSAFVAALGGMRNDLAARSVPLLAIVFPVFDSRLDTRYPYRESHARLGDLLATLEIPAVDLLEDFRGMDAARLAVEPNLDPHPNEIAHRVAAERIEDELFARRLLPLPRALERSGYTPPPIR